VRKWKLPTIYEIIKGVCLDEGSIADKSLIHIMRVIYLKDNRNFRLKARWWLVLMVAVLLSPLPLFATIVSRNVALDLALSMKPNVVTATLQSAKDLGAYTQNLVFQIHEIMHTEQASFPVFLEQNGNKITYLSFVWPKRLCALEAGQFVIAFFRLTQSGEADLAARSQVVLMDIVPTSYQSFPVGSVSCRNT
jgi:hypothetical protein